MQTQKNPNPIFLKRLRALNHNRKRELTQKVCVPNTAGRIRAHLATVLNYFGDYDNQPNSGFVTTKVVCGVTGF